MNSIVQVKSGDHTTMATNVPQQMEDAGSASVALGAGMMLLGVLLGLIWVWLTFFRRSKSPRNGMAGGSGQVRPKFSSAFNTSDVFCAYDFISTGSHPLSGTFCTSRFFILCVYALL